MIILCYHNMEDSIEYLESKMKFEKLILLGWIGTIMVGNLAEGVGAMMLTSGIWISIIIPGIWIFL